MGDVVADMKKDKRYGGDDNNCPEVDQLGGEDVGIAVGEDDEVIAFDVAEGEEYVCGRIL